MRARDQDPDPDGTNGPSSGAGGEPEGSPEEPVPRRNGSGPIPGSVTPRRVCACGAPGTVQEHSRWLCFDCRFTPEVAAELDADGAA